MSIFFIIREFSRNKIVNAINGLKIKMLLNLFFRYNFKKKLIYLILCSRGLQVCFSIKRRKKLQLVVAVIHRSSYLKIIFTFYYFFKNEFLVVNLKQKGEVRKLKNIKKIKIHKLLFK